MEIKTAAEREIKRVKEFLPSVELAKPEGSGLISFAKDYAKDANFFFEHGKFVEAFEAAIISWAYIDISLKLKLVSVDNKLLKYFTVDKA